VHFHFPLVASQVQLPEVVGEHPVTHACPSAAVVCVHMSMGVVDGPQPAMTAPITKANKVRMRRCSAFGVPLSRPRRAADLHHPPSLTGRHSRPARPDRVVAARRRSRS
jgi:hypothetical protein